MNGIKRKNMSISFDIVGMVEITESVDRQNKTKKFYTLEATLINGKTVSIGHSDRTYLDEIKTDFEIYKGMSTKRI